MDKWFEELKAKKIWVSDVGNEDSEIELLIGADVAGKLMTGCIQQLKSGLTAVETKLGWTVMGKLPEQPQKKPGTAMLATSLLVQELAVADLWKLEAIGIHDPMESKTQKEQELAARKHFQETVKVDSKGRYEVALPFIEGHPELLDNRAMAEKRLISATRKLVSNGQYEAYQAVFDEWLAEGVIEVVPTDEMSSFGHYLPHRGVFKENSTTKVRPVFDASAKVKPFPSLNDCLEKGPNLVELIPSVLARFRIGCIGAIADIKKAFLQIAVRAEDCDFLRFLWWKDNEQKEMEVLRHRRVVFGVNCSPFLLGAVINLHLGCAPPSLRATAEKLLDSLYVDNCVSSVDTKEDLDIFMLEAKKLLSSAHFDLRGWEHTGNTSNPEENSTQVLGLLWDRFHDELFCAPVHCEDMGCSLTKRKVLSIAQKIFDPIGFTCPVTLFPKCLLQESWKLKIGWDAELPTEMCKGFRAWAKDLQLISRLRIPRQLAHKTGSENLSLHVFCDASQVAYAAAVFLRSELEGHTSVQLVQAKSRVAPLKRATIPRLELLACTIGSRLVSSVVQSLHLEMVPNYYWSDSTTALCWIKREDHWGTFVGNRVKEIRLHTNPESWRHVPGDQNPADLPSRGCSIKHLQESKWWEGPNWLKSKEGCWPTSYVAPNEEEVNGEKRKGVISSMLIHASDKGRWYMNYYSEYNRCLRMTAWVLRFIKNAHCKSQDRVKSELTVSELKHAEEKLLKIVQKETFDEAKIKELKSLCIFEGESGLLRVKTGIGRRIDSETFKYPILLPYCHPLVDALIRAIHLKLCHAGSQIVLSNLREKFWILKSRKAIRRVLQKCVMCRRFEAKRAIAVPAELPEDRVKDASVFEIVGVDLTGPLYLKNEEKAWIVLFTCAIYRAVHFELVTALSTEAFLQSFRRFISRRGRPAIVYSDNGTNFTGADNLLKSLDPKRVQEFAVMQRIQWKFNPPTAAWWGGWWERIVRMLKQLLRKVLGRSSLTYEEMTTILCDAEAVINSRPLTYISEDAADLQPLTPAMFLQDIKESGVPELDVLNTTSANKRLRYRQRVMEDLRKRFRSEYLGQLMLHKGAKGDSHPVRVGDVVLIGSDNMKRLNWPMGKVIEVFPGKDGSVRVVKIKTATGTLTRPIQRVYRMEVTGQEVIIKEKARAISKPKEILKEKVICTRSGRIVRAPNKFTA